MSNQIKRLVELKQLLSDYSETLQSTDEFFKEMQSLKDRFYVPKKVPRWRQIPWEILGALCLGVFLHGLRGIVQEFMALF